MKKFVMSYSCGKDSTLSLYRMIKRGHTPLALLVTVDKKVCRSWFHGIPEHLLNEVSASLEIELDMIKCQGEEYKTAFEKTLRKWKEQGADACVFGDIDLEAHRAWCTDRCKEANIEAIFQLWQEDREELVYEFIDSGFKTVIKNVKLECMGEGFLGKVLTKDLVNDIKATGSDPCGENGEYHTFVYDGPLFKYPIKFEYLNIVKNETHGFLDVKEKEYE